MRDMNAEIIAVGSEMLTPAARRYEFAVSDRSSEYLGVEVVAKHVIGDDRERLADGDSARADSVAVLLIFGRPRAHRRRSHARRCGAWRWTGS